MQQVAFRKLRMLNCVITLKDLSVRLANRLGLLGCGRSGQHSIRINDQWRICFQWRASDVFEVEILEEDRLRDRLQQDVREFVAFG
jgi:toxin HigB-1